MAHILNELSNDIYDHNSITEGDVNLIKSHGICPYTVFLGVFVSLIPKVCLNGFFYSITPQNVWQF